MAAAATAAAAWLIPAPAFPFMRDDVELRCVAGEALECAPAARYGDIAYLGRYKNAKGELVERRDSCCEKRDRDSLTGTKQSINRKSLSTPHSL